MSAGSSGVPNGIRTRVLALKGPRPRPLDDGDSGEQNRCDFNTLARSARLRARAICDAALVLALTVSHRRESYSPLAETLDPSSAEAVSDVYPLRCQLQLASRPQTQPSLPSGASIHLPVTPSGDSTPIFPTSPSEIRTKCRCRV